MATVKKLQDIEDDLGFSEAMNRRQFHLAALSSMFFISPSRGVGRATVQPGLGTQWSIVQSEGYDALCFWAALAGEALPARQYAAELATFVPRLDRDFIETMSEVHRQVSAGGNVLTHSACRFFSAGPHRTIDDLLHSARNIDTVLKPRHQADPEWEGDALWERYRAFMPVVIRYLEGLKAAGFSIFWQDLYQRQYANRAADVLRLATPYDAVAEAQFLTGRQFAPEVEITLTYFSYPRGMRMIGQQFVTWAGYSDEVILNTSVHELMHPPLDLNGAAMQAAVAAIQQDPFWTDVITRRDPALGDIGDLPNFIEECMVQGLDQIASERRGASRRAVDFFSRGNGSHVLAASIYGLLRQDDYHRTGGNFEVWVGQAVADGRFSQSSLETAGRYVLGASPRTVWQAYIPPGSQ